jgi:hypothetical protein
MSAMHSKSRHEVNEKEQLGSRSGCVCHRSNSSWYPLDKILGALQRLPGWKGEFPTDVKTRIQNFHPSSRPHRRQARYHLNYFWQREYAYFYETFELRVKKVENKIVYYKETNSLLGSQRRVHCQTAEPEPNRRVSIERVPLSVSYPMGTRNYFSGYESDHSPQN